VRKDPIQTEKLFCSLIDLNLQFKGGGFLGGILLVSLIIHRDITSFLGLEDGLVLRRCFQS